MIRWLFVSFGLWVSLVGTPSPASTAEHAHGAAPPPEAGSVPLYAGLGPLHHAISTRVPAAQRYFDQGLRLCYAFNHDEAIRAFREAARLDPRCAMAHWGIALALGPNVNLPVDAAREHEAHHEVGLAQERAPNASPRERDYIEALAQRYSDDPNADLHALDNAYAEAMRRLSAKYPRDVDAAVLYAEATLDIRPWDWWTLAGTPQPGTLDAIAALESVLRAAPSHIGANHLYIHAVEESPHPERALLCANRLAALAPNAGHLVHMPSHTYLLLGRYHAAAELNLKAIDVDRAYIEKEKPQGIYPVMYYVHNMHMAWAAMSMEGRSREALDMARRVAQNVPVGVVRQMPPMEFWLPVPYFALARFGKWEEILRIKPPPADLRYTTAMWRYARGLAFAAQGRPDLAATERDSLFSIADAIPPDQVIGLNRAQPLLRIARAVLEAEIGLRGGIFDYAIEQFGKAVAEQDSLHYDEPPAWYYPVRQSLGIALLKSGKAEEAEAIYREDLKKNPGNGWSLLGLTQSLEARGRVTEALKARHRFARAWARADVSIPGSTY